MTALLPRVCPVCDSGEKEILFDQSFSKLSEGGLTAGYKVAVCSKCGFGYADQIPDQATFDRYYAEMSKYEYDQRAGQESSSDLERFVDIAEEIRPFIPHPESRILDLGCSTGRLLSILRDRGFSQVFGLDPSPACSRHARELYNVPVFTGSLAQNNLPECPFDFLIMIGVLEHIRELGESLTQIARLLPVAGRILIEVPDATDFASWQDAPYQQFSTEHICFFSSVSLTNLMSRHGFRLVHERILSRNYTPSTVMPVVTNIYEKIETAQPILVQDTQTDPALRLYIEKSKVVDDRIQRVIDELVRSQKRVLVWGVGTHTQRLMESSNLSRVNIAAFVDSNAKYQSKTLEGVEIISPDQVKERQEPILISSRVFQGEICAQIQVDLGYPNEIVTLYEL